MELVFEMEFEEIIKRIFFDSEFRYGFRKIKICLNNEGIIFLCCWI